jgi:hypothetical protein
VDAVARGGAVEKEVDLMIRRRDDKRRETEGERRVRELWAESEARHADKRREENRLAWCTFHEDQAARHRAVLEALIGHHQAAAEKYRENGHHEEDSCCSAQKAK